jgi:predicted ester cyclase
MTQRPRNSLDGFHATKAAQRADELVCAFFEEVNTGNDTAIDTALARNFQSYSVDGARSRTGLKKYYAGLRHSFSDLHYEVHENVGVLVENDLIALRTIVTGIHSGEYAGVAATGKKIQTSTSHLFRLRDDQLVEHWQVMDTYRILARLGVVPGVAATFQQVLGVPPLRRASSWRSWERLSMRLGKASLSPAMNRVLSAVASMTALSRRARLRMSRLWQIPTSRTRAGLPTAARTSAMPGR